MRWLWMCAVLITAGCPSAAPVSGETHEETREQRFYATFGAPCGRSVLELRTAEDAKPIVVQPTGNESPTRKLGYDMLVRGKFIVYGRLHRDRLIDDKHCGAYPKFEVTRFEPWGPVERCTSVGAASLQRYTEGLPTDRYIPEDYAGGPSGKVIDACVEPTNGSCPAPKVKQTSCDDTVWCCLVR